MKLNNLFAVVFGAALLVSCSDDDGQKFNWNTAPDVTVEMAKTSITVKENASRFSVPVIVSGEPNGYVQVKFDIIEQGAIEDINFIITTKTLNINSEDKVAYVEIAPVDFDDEDPMRSFILNIAEVKGAAVGVASETLVNIKDKGQSPKLDALENTTWECSYLDYDGSEASFTSKLVVDNLADGSCHLESFIGEDICSLPLIYEYDEKTRFGKFVINNGVYICTGVSFNQIGVADIQVGNASGNTSIEQRYVGNWIDDEYTTVSWQGSKFMLMITQNGASTGYLFDAVENLTMVKQ